LNALNPWLSPTLANAEIENTKNTMEIIAQAINRIAVIYEKQEQRAIRQEQRDLVRHEKQEQRAQLVHRLNLMKRAEGVRSAQKRELRDDKND